MKIGYHRLDKMLVVCILLLAIVQPAATRAAPETPTAPALDD